MKTRTHKFLMTITFDRACTATEALYHVRNDGDINTDKHYTSDVHPGPETFKVRSIKWVKK